MVRRKIGMYKALKSQLSGPIWRLFFDLARDMYTDPKSRLEEFSNESNVEYADLEIGFQDYLDGLKGDNGSYEITKEFSAIVKEICPNKPEEPNIEMLKHCLKEIHGKYDISLKEMEWRFFFYYMGLIDRNDWTKKKGCFVQNPFQKPNQMD